MPRTSDKKEKILEFIREFSNEKGYAPTVREIGQAVGLRSPASVQYQLNQLRQEGLLSESAGSRTTTLPDMKQSRIPVVGVVTAGAPILAVENIQAYMPWDGDEECFALRVRGDSMLGAGILPGDHVVVRPQNSADHGDIVVALLEDEATVKRLYRRDGKILLIPENPAYDPIDGEKAVILGKVRAVVRKY